MALIHEFENSGNWLFRRRGWLPAIIFIPILAYLFIEGSEKLSYNLAEEMVFLGISLFGLLLRIITVGRTPGKTSGRNTKKQLAEQINTNGIYSLVRHPLYLGNFFMWLGPVLFLRSISFTIIFGLAYWLYYERIMFAEEQFLRGKFGEEYDKWASRVPAFIPSFRNYKRAELPFSFRNILKRENTGFTLIFLVFALLDLARNFSEGGVLRMNNIWLYLVIFAVIFWLVFRILRKNTTILNVKGR